MSIQFNANSKLKKTKNVEKVKEVIFNCIYNTELSEHKEYSIMTSTNYVYMHTKHDKTDTHTNANKMLL